MRWRNSLQCFEFCSDSNQYACHPSSWKTSPLYLLQQTIPWLLLTLWKTSWWKNSISWMKRHTSAPNRYEKEKLILFFLLENLSRDSKCLRDNHRFHLLFRLEKVSGVFLAVTYLGWLGRVCGKKAKWLIAVASQNNSFEGIRKCVWKDFNSWLYLL